MLNFRCLDCDHVGPENNQCAQCASRALITDSVEAYHGITVLELEYEVQL